MELELGQRVFDMSTRSIVLADANAPQAPLADAIYATGGGDDLVTSVQQLVAEHDLPVIAATRFSELADRCLRAGAAAIHAGLLQDALMLAVIAEANATVIVGDPDAGRPAAALERARWAEAAGLKRSEIMIQAPVDSVAEMARHGYLMLVDAGGAASAQGTHVQAVMAGARIVRSNDVRATKRTVSTVSELLERRGITAPCAVESTAGR